jgi:hypothetical protein
MNANDVISPWGNDRARIHRNRRGKHAPELMVGMVAADLAATRRGKQHRIALSPNALSNAFVSAIYFCFCDSSASP